MNAYAIDNHYGIRTLGGQALHVFASRAERDAWVDRDPWHGKEREPVTFEEAWDIRAEICQVLSHGTVSVPERLESICRGVWPYWGIPIDADAY